MRKQSVILFTITNKDEYHTYGLYSLKAYALSHLTHSPLPAITTRVYRAASEAYEDDSVSLKLTDREIQKAADAIVRKSPAILGLSASVINRRALLRIAQAVKKLNPGIIIVVGGPETHHNYMYDSDKFMLSEPSVDIIAKFEGEEIFVELLESILYRTYSLDRIKGIVYRKDGKVVATGERMPMDLRKIPSPYITGVLKPKKTITEFIVENSRGCPYRCAYCSYPAGINRFLRYFPAERVIDDFIFLLKHRVKYINVADNNFNINKNHFKKVLETIIKYNKNGYTKISSFYNASREIISDDILKLLAESRLNITIGVQSLNEKTLRTANRENNLKILERNLTRMDAHGVSYRLEFIYGLPGDTYEDIKKTVNWIFGHRAFWIFFYRLVVLKGTYFSEHAQELGLYYDEKAPFRIVKNNELSARDLEKIERMLVFVSIFYNRPALRTYMYQLGNLFHLPYDRLFEALCDWYDKPQNKLLDKKYMQTITKRFMRYLFEHYSAISGKRIEI